MVRIPSSIHWKTYVRNTERGGQRSPLVPSAYASERRVPGMHEALGIAMCCGWQALASFQLGNHVEQDKWIGNLGRWPDSLQWAFAVQVWVRFNYIWTQEPWLRHNWSPPWTVVAAVKICLSLWLSQEPDITLIIKQRAKEQLDVTMATCLGCCWSLGTRAFYYGSLRAKGFIYIISCKNPIISGVTLHLSLCGSTGGGGIRNGHCWLQ